MKKSITCLAGGVGAAKFLEGLASIVPNDNLTIIVNTGDDIELHGLHISPDIDIIMYTLAGMVDPEKGWGIRNDTFHCLEMLRKYGRETWFRLGDKDLATHIYRTQLLENGYTLTEITRGLCRRLGLRMKILPMSHDKVEPLIVTKNGVMHFEEYLVKRQAKDEVINVIFKGSKKAQPAPGVVESILHAEIVILCPSNPIVSIGTILSLKKIQKALKTTKAKIIAISPIVGGAALKGPADKLLKGLGLDVSAFSVANLYKDFLDIFIIDQIDRNDKPKIETLGIQVIVTNTIMKTLRDKINLAKEVLNLLESL